MKTYKERGQQKQSSNFLKVTLSTFQAVGIFCVNTRKHYDIVLESMLLMSYNPLV